MSTTLEEILRRSRERQQQILAPYQPSQQPSLLTPAGDSRSRLPMVMNQQQPRFVVPDDWQAPVTSQQLPDDMLGPLGKVFDFLSRPLYASANVAKALIDGDGNLAAAAWRGLTGEEKTTFTKLLQAQGVPWAEALGFILDNGLDPLTYIPVANVLGKVFKGVRGTAAARRIASVIEELDPVAIARNAFGERGATLAEGAMRRGQAVIDWFGRSFSTSYKLPEDYVLARRLARYHFTEGQRQILEDLRTFVREIPEHERRLMAYARENPELFHKLSPKAQQKLIELSDELDEYLQRAVDEGLLTAEGADQMRGRYVPHRFSARLKSFGFIPGQRVLTPTFVRERSFNSLAELRAYRDDVMRLAEATSTAEAAQIAKLLDEKWQTKTFSKNVAVRGDDLKRIQDWAKEVARYHTPIEDMAQLMAIYRNEWLQYEARKKFLETVEQKWAKKVPANSIVGPDEGLYLPLGNLRFFRQELAKAGLKPDEVVEIMQEMNKALERGELVFEVPESLRKTVVGVTRNVQAWLLPKEIARDLNRASMLITGTSSEGQQLLKWFDKVTGHWKALATTWRLPFHMRNFYSNYFQMWLGDVRVQDFPALTKDAVKILRGSDEIIKGTGKTGRELLQEFRNLGIVPRGSVMGGFEQELLNVEKLVNGTLLKGLSKNDAWNLFTSLPKDFALAVEGSARVAMMLDGLRKGMTPIEAMRRTFKYLFDYDEITPFEREVLARLIPFYRWMRFNIPLQIQTFLTNPQKYLKTARAIQAINEWAEIRHEDYEILPDWMKEFGWLKLPWRTDKGEDLYVYIDLPVRELATVTSLTGVAGAKEQREAALDILSGLNPIVDLFLTFLNVRTYPLGEAGRVALERVPGEMTRAPWWLGLMPQAFLEWVGAGPMLDRKSGRMVLGWTKKAEQLIYTVVPAAREYDKLFTAAFSPIEEDRSPWRIVSFVTGIRFTPVDKFEERRWRAIERKQKLEQAALKVFQLGRPLTPEELEAILRS